MTQEEIERAFVAFCMDMRIQGVHPDWFPLWLGANRLNEEFVGRLRFDAAGWPTAAHFRAPDMSSPFPYGRYYAEGLPKWKALLEKLDAESGRYGDSAWGKPK